jgi:hypothetical protein
MVGEMTYDVMGRRVLDYEICAYDGSRLRFRGPKRDLTNPYIAFLGTTETFGKFIAAPYPDLLSQTLPAGAVNLGLVNGGVDAYLNDPAILEVAKNAQLRVVQIMGALNLSNPYFTVHPRRNDRFIAARDMLKSLFPEVDFTRFAFTKAMLSALRETSVERYEMVCKELQDIWLARMTVLLKLLGDRTVLLWFAAKTAPENAMSSVGDPVLIDADMVARMRAQVNAYVEFVPEKSVLETGTEGMLFSVVEKAAAKQLMGPKAHVQAAQALQEMCSHLMR